MVNQYNLILNTASQVTSTIDQQYDGYDADLVKVFSQILVISAEESNTNQKRNRIEELVKEFTRQMMSKMGEA